MLATFISEREGASLLWKDWNAAPAQHVVWGDELSTALSIRAGASGCVQWHPSGMPGTNLDGAAMEQLWGPLGAWLDLPCDK